MVLLVTGGAGFIGSNFLHLFVRKHPGIQFINLDALTYAGNLMNLESIADAPNYRFVKADLANMAEVRQVFETYAPTHVIHFAAETHVDRSIHGPDAFIRTNVYGMYNLLECCRSAWSLDQEHKLVDVSTDEVYGSLGSEGAFTEASPFAPNSPYSASKASADLIARSYYRTFGVPVSITHCSNNFGPMQFPEKLIPLMILNAIEGKKLPIYGAGQNVRDWLYVEDHCDALWAVLTQGRIGDTYAIGGGTELANILIVSMLCEEVAEQTGISVVSLRANIEFVPDRPGHDFRYAIDSTKIARELGWSPKHEFRSALKETVRWYLNHPQWVAAVKSGDYRTWLKDHYGVTA
ncbi:MAG: dTDP-glucose 4,6-dehydratase [Fimbriimonadaceae bacterium]